MRTTQITVVVILAAVFLPLGLAKIAAVPAMRQAAAHLGMSPGFYRVVGTLEVAGVFGLLAGLSLSLLGAAAATGLALLMTGAAVAHLRNDDPPVRALPAAVLALISVACVVLSATA